MVTVFVEASGVDEMEGDVDAYINIFGTKDAQYATLIGSREKIAHTSEDAARAHVYDSIKDGDAKYVFTILIPAVGAPQVLLFDERKLLGTGR